MAQQYFSIKNCEFAFKCPRVWERLAATENDNERHCASCEKLVYLCEDDATLAFHVQAGHCVAIEDAISAGSMVIGRVASNYSAPTPEQPQALDEGFLGLKIAPSRFEQTVDFSGKINWD